MPNKPRKLKVLMYGWEFPPYINGGLGIACFGIVQALLRKNIHVGLVLPQANQEQRKIADDIFQHDDLITYSVNSIIKPYMDVHAFDQAKKEIADKFLLGNDLFEEVKRYAYEAGQLAKIIPHDVIHAHDWLTILAGIEAKKISGKPLCFHVHALEIDRCGTHGNPDIFAIEKAGLDQADKIFAVSQYTRDRIVHHYGISAKKITVVYNGLSESYLESLPLSSSKKSNLVLFLGRVTYQKGPFHFVDVANTILAARKDIQFAIVGVGDLLRPLIEYAAKLRIGSYVHFLGFLDRVMLKKIYQMSKVYVMPSLSEPFGISCLEALSLNVPVIISKQSGVAEVLNNVFKVDFWDTQSMAEKIMALVDYPVLGKEILKNTQKDLLELRWDNSVQYIVQTYYELRGT